MAKRRAAVDSDDEDGYGSPQPATKRSRTADGSEDTDGEAPRATQRKANGKGKGKERATRDDASDMDEDDEDEPGMQEPDEDEEKKFEEENEERIRERLMNKTKVQGGIAEMGIIESIEMTQFMCHKYLTFSLGPQINFIIGHNGSGKSAVLTALTVALGGKANSTGRGSGLKSFIREGQSVAEVTVQLKNQGEEAFRPQDFGKSIVITRRFTKDGSSSYKIRSKDGKLISTKREDLQAICDHMNIQVDNPMNILTQDSARQFLSASSPADKYKFFLKGTQLSQLSEEYQTCMENISQTAKTLKRKAEVLPDLEDSYEEARARYEEAKRAREQRHKADELKKELAWAHVSTKEMELQRKLTEVAQVKHRVEKNEEAMRASEMRRDACDQNVATVEEEALALGNVDDLHARKNALNDQIKGHKNKLGQFRHDERAISDSKERLDKTIADLNDQIRTEQARLESDSRQKRDRANNQLQQVNADIAQKEAELKRIHEEQRRFMEEADTARKEEESLLRDERELRQRVAECDEQITRCHSVKANKLAQFGPNMEILLNEIQQMRWYGQPPVGPFGRFVRVRDPKRWAPIMRVIIGNSMNTFAITDARDRPALAQVLKKHGNSNAPIIISKVDMFDYSEGEPPQQFLTVLRAIEVTNDYVLRQLITNMHIEATMLAQTRKEADQMLIAHGRGGQAVSADLYRVSRFPEGGGQSNSIPPMRGNDFRHQLFNTNNAEAEIQHWVAQKDDHMRRLEDLLRRLQEARDKFSRSRPQANDMDSRARAMAPALRQLKTARDNLQLELNEETPVNIQALQETLNESEAEKQSVMEQFAQLVAAKSAVQDEVRPLVAEVERLRVQITEFGERKADVVERVNEAVHKRLVEQTAVEHYKSKIAAENEKLQRAEEVANDVQTEFQDWTDKALKFCERIENPRNPEVVQRNLDAVQAALRERERRQGASVEEIAEEMQRKKAALDVVKKELKSLTLLNRALKKSIKVRIARWHEFRRHIALRCKVYFGYHLSNRGYFGKVLFDHVNGKLDLKVNTDDQSLTQQNNREKDPRSLSGGEKSFSTICLLLSLWESIGCPIRCLDEFDVFMDAVNRRISMRMMIDTANASNRKQYVLITPQDMTNIQIGNTVRVHRMTDPERGQGTLAFS